MASFPDDATTWDRLDYRLLRDHSGVTLYHSEAILDEDLAWLRAEGYRVAEIDCAAWTSPDAAHDTLAAALDFPGWYGRNLDALNDCFRDIEVPEEGGLAIVLRKADLAAKLERSFLSHVTDIAAGAARERMLVGGRILTLLQSDDPWLDLPPVDAVKPGWNRREWSHASRGGAGGLELDLRIEIEPAAPEPAGMRWAGRGLRLAVWVIVFAVMLGVLFDLCTPS